MKHQQAQELLRSGITFVQRDQTWLERARKRLHRPVGFCCTKLDIYREQREEGKLTLRGGIVRLIQQSPKVDRRPGLSQCVRHAGVPIQEPA